MGSSWPSGGLAKRPSLKPASAAVKTDFPGNILEAAAPFFVALGRVAAQLCFLSRVHISRLGTSSWEEALETSEVRTVFPEIGETIVGDIPAEYNKDDLLEAFP